MIVLVAAARARADQVDPVEALRAEIEQLRRELRAKEAIDDERAARLEEAIAGERAARAEATPGITAAGVALDLGVFVQVDAVLDDESSADELDPSTREPLNEDRVLLRRGRIRVDGSRGLVAAGLELDASTVRGPAVRLYAAELTARAPWRGDDLPEVEAIAGLYRIPFGLETRQGYRRRLFLEPGNAVRALFPGEYDLGAGLDASWRWLRAEVAVMNGEPVGERSLPGRDPNAAKDVIGRIGVTVGGGRVGVEVGVSATSGEGFHAGTAPTKDTLVWRDANEDGLVQLTELQVVPGVAATPSASFGRFAIGGDLSVTLELDGRGAVRAYGEVIRGKNMDRGMFVADPVSAARDLRETGAMIAVTWEGWRGALAGVRWDRYDPDADAFERQGAQVVPRDPVVSTLAIAAGWRLRGSGRILVEYDHQRNPFGRDAGAEPTTRADDSVTIRAEAGF